MNVLPLMVLLPLVVGTACCLAVGRANSRARRAATAAAAGAVALAVLALLIAQAPAVFAGQPAMFQAPWAPAIGLDLHLRLDALGWTFAALISGMGVLVIVYAAHYLGEDDPAGKFFSTLMLFMAAMLGIVLADNLLLLLVFWELTSLSSFLLIGYWGRLEASRARARMALAVTGGGGLVLLAGVMVLGRIAGTYDVSAMLAQADAIRAHPHYPLALALILVGCFTKSAQWPFHFWLPAAMAAPTPVSAYLHSATMVKAGLFLLMRLYPVMGGTALFEGVVASVGLLTMVFAAFVAIFRHDLKGLLAYSTVSHLGLITFLIGLSSPTSTAVAVFHVLNHAAFKAALFMSAGIVDHETGTRDLRRLGGLFALMPVVGTLVMVASAAMAGLPPFNGFISKEMMLDESVRSATGLWGTWGWAVPALATLGGLFSVAYSIRLVHDGFFGGPPRDLARAHVHEPPWGMKAPVLLLSAACVVIGLVPGLVEPLVRVTAHAVLGAEPPPVELALWHGLNLPLAMSAVALIGGSLLYAALRREGRLHRHVEAGVAARALFTALVDGLFALSGRVTHALETGSLQRHLTWMLTAVVALSAWALWRDAAWSAAPAELARPGLPATPLAVALWLLVLALGAALCLQHRERYVAVLLTGGVGLVASLTFLGLSAPDLAMTQLSVDIVSTVLLLMGLALLPQAAPRESSARRRVRDASLALACGLGVAVLAWAMMTRHHDSISWYFLEQSVPKGGGTNVVNVILVDFRGYDTFGEITVLGIAAVGVLALLDGWRVRRTPLDAHGQPWSFAREPLLLRQVSGVVLPLALVASAYIFWRGHNEPGGGFIAGLVTAVALVLQYMAQGQARTDALLHSAGGRRFTRWIAIGLGIAWLTGVGAFTLGRPFLTSAHGVLQWPVLGDLPLATAALFDLGVYVTVVGSTLLMLTVLGAASKPLARGGAAMARGVQR